MNYLLQQSFYNATKPDADFVFSRVLGQKLETLSSHDISDKENVSLKRRSSYYNRAFSYEVTAAILDYQKQ